MANILGIDLGTTNTSASLILNAGAPIPIKFSKEPKPDTIRSMVLKVSEDQWFVGEAARERARSDAGLENSILTGFKPLLGLPERGQTMWKVIESKGILVDDMVSMSTRRIGGEMRYVYTAETLNSALCPPGMTLSDVTRATQEILAAVKQQVHVNYGRISLDRVVIGVPVSFPDVGRARILDAAVGSGLVDTPSKIVLFPEPIAVALAYGIEYRTPKRVLVFDHGGGTLDLAIVDIAGHPNGDFRYQVLAQAVHERAGRYYDRLFLAGIMAQAGARGTEALRLIGITDPMLISSVRYLDEAELRKEQLSKLNRRRITNPVRFTQQFGTLSFQEEVSEELFNSVIQEELDEIRRKIGVVVEEAAEFAQKIGRPGKVQEIVMAGGSAQLPAMRHMLEDLFPGVTINDRYAGSRTTTSGFARAIQYRQLIDELVDTKYSILNPHNGEVVPTVHLGMPLKDCCVAAQQGVEDGFYIQSDDNGEITVLVFACVNERQIPILQGNIVSKPSDVLQIIVQINPDSGRPEIHAVSCETGKHLPVTTVLPGSQAFVTTLEPGQIIRFRCNQIKNYKDAAEGCIQSIIQMQEGKEVPRAIGDLTRYRLVVRHPDGSEVHVKTSADCIDTYAIDMPKPGEFIELGNLKCNMFKPLEAGEMKAFQQVSRPNGITSPAKKTIAVTPSCELNRAVDEQPIPTKPNQSIPRRRIIGDRLGKLLNSIGKNVGSGQG